ncbi:SDR family NAD(P)-dependent oxidoreductase [Paenarthrobacter nicotinovorans]|uniref:SDR family NAD(P)-dependent oxidoreductase n=1 Tax=Paenarthrobacter nicotinovorans TaxID=29320 RepID=UPI00380E196C
MSRFSSKSALVTGAGSGIGRRIAEALAREGAKVVVTDIDETAAKETALGIAEAGGRVLALRQDASNPDDAQDVVDAAVSTFGGLHLAVNNAGVGTKISPVGGYPVDEWTRAMDVNLNGVFYGLRTQLPAIAASGGGAVVNMSSVLGSVARPGNPAYVAAKHAVVGLTKVAALDYAQQGVRINAVGPAYIDTPLLNRFDDDTRRELISRHPLGRLGTAQEVANLVLFLLSAEASFITGSYHLVDGGYTTL